jgi:hypothetical protein
LLRQPRQDLETDLGQTLVQYSDSYAIRQKDFEQRLTDAVIRARDGLDSKVEQWRSIHWATLKAIVVRHGRFTSPSTHTRYDLGGSIADSLLETMPFVWDDFFGNFCENKLAELRGHLAGKAEVFLARLQGEARMAGVFSEQTISDINASVDVSKKHIEFHTNEILNGLQSTVRRVRTDLALSVNETIQEMMLPAFEAASEESGKGMKQRILEILWHRAKNSEAAMFTTIETDLRNGITELGLQFRDRVHELNRKVLGNADQTLANLKIEDVDAGEQTSLSDRMKYLRETETEIIELLDNLDRTS